METGHRHEGRAMVVGNAQYLARIELAEEDP